MGVHVCLLSSSEPWSESRWKDASICIAFCCYGSNMANLRNISGSVTKLNKGKNAFIDILLWWVLHRRAKGPVKHLQLLRCPQWSLSIHSNQIGRLVSPASPLSRSYELMLLQLRAGYSKIKSTFCVDLMWVAGEMVVPISNSNWNGNLCFCNFGP